MLCPLCKKEQKDSGYCSECNKLYHKKWYQQNKQVQREKARKYSQTYRQKNKDKILDYQRRYQTDRKEQYLNYLKDWRIKNKDKVQQYNSQYREKHKEIQNIWVYARRHFKDKMMKEIGKCQGCGNKDGLEIHHIRYINNRENLMLLCKSCHRLKHR